MKRSKRKKKEKEYARTKPLILRVLPEDRKAIKQKAKEFAHGNVSAWIRYASSNHALQRGERITSARYIRKVS